VNTAVCILFPHMFMTSVHSGISGGTTGSAFRAGNWVLSGWGPMRQKKRHLGS
jgi:hypothetical protein